MIHIVGIIVKIKNNETEIIKSMPRGSASNISSYPIPYPY
jgi:hypothetical protein